MKTRQRLAVPTSNPKATPHSLTRRRFLGTTLIAGAGTLVGTAPFAEPRVAAAPFFKGMCYQPFPQPYDPSHANTTCIFFGSDIAYNCMEPLWGSSFTSRSGRTFPGRNDFQTLKQMGVNLLRLYDWEPRNFHKRFLDKCVDLGIKVLAPVSRYFLNPGQGFPDRRNLIPKLIQSFSNGEANNGTTYHPAIAGIIMGNEPGICQCYTVEQCSEFTKDWVEAEKRMRFPTTLPIGHPVDFGKDPGERFPKWNFWETLLDRTHLQHLKNRLFLAPQPQNPGSYLFRDAEGTGRGYVPQTYEKFGVPLLFTELGHNRQEADYQAVVRGQLEDSIAYGAAHPEQFLGICHFQFADKVWKCPSFQCRDSEGSFGTHSHTNTVLVTVDYVSEDFTHVDEPHFNCDNQQLKPDMLVQNPTYAIAKEIYTKT
jgi:hypothetical protein